MNLFPFSEFWWFYAAFTLFVLFLLSLDLGIFHRKSHTVSFKEATVWSIIWVALALAFNFLLYQYSVSRFGAETAWRVATEFLSGFIVEYSLSVDNIFIFVLVFSHFAIPPQYRHRVLFYGILGALVFRSLFIGIGAFLINFHWIILIFGGFLILTGVKMIFSKETEIEPEKNYLIRLVKKFIPVSTKIEGKQFFVRKDGQLMATPLFIALVFLEATDLIFAVDSVPAIFALTKEPLIVFTSNIFAILGLRSMYFMLAGAVDRFHLLKYGLAVILIFVGLKMVWLNDLYDGKFPISWSLGIIVGFLAVSIIFSLLFPKKASKDLQ
ncbi:MAG: TerC family protein [Pyrinomonadaceae bacterium]